MASSPGRLAGALTAAAISLAVLAQPAAAKITFSGVGDARLNMSESDLNDALGPPTSKRPGRNQATDLLRYRRQKLEVLVHREQQRVVSISTTSRAERTSAGLGVGVAASTVRGKIRGEKCSAFRNITVCNVQRDDRVMDFEIRRGKVFRVTVADVD